MEVLDVAKHKNEPITIGGQTLRVTKFDIADALISMQFEVSAPQLNMPGKRPMVTVYDAAGERMFESRIVRTSSIGMAKRPGPYKLVVSVPEKTTEVVVPFEFKGLPMP